MGELQILETTEMEVPRWVQIFAGVILAVVTLLCGLGSVTILIGPNDGNHIFTVVIGWILLLGCVWIFEKCFRLLTGRKNQGGLMSPNTLRIVSYFFLAPPVAGLFTGYYQRWGLVAIFQVLMYFLSFLGLRMLARKREAANEQTNM